VKVSNSLNLEVVLQSTFSTCVSLLSKLSIYTHIQNNEAMHQTDPGLVVLSPVFALSIGEDLASKLEDPKKYPSSCKGQEIPSGGHGKGTGWAMNVGMSCPGITTDTPIEYVEIVEESSNLSKNRIPSSTSMGSRGLFPVPLPSAGEEEEELGLKNLSKIAITKNIEIRMAVATNPKDTALTELSKFLQ